MSWLISVLVLGVLILVHEAGHFVVARWCGVTVERFAIGFGPKLLSWRWGNVEYFLRLFPLGGYVKMAGEQHTDEHPVPDGFMAQPPSKRGLIVFAGPLVNYITSVLTLWLVLVVGYPELLPSVGRVMDDMPAMAAGLQVNDRIVSIDGQPIRTWDELTKIVHRSPDRPLQLAVDRAGQPVTLAVTPKGQEITDPFGRRLAVGLMGIAPSGAFGTYRVGPAEAVGETFRKQWEWTRQIFLSLYSLFRGRMSFKESFTGPIGILYMTSEAVRMGPSPLLYIVSIFSFSLALFNVFPIPILDGGHLLYIFLEVLRGGRTISLRAQEQAAKVSFALLITLLVVVCVNDVSRFGLVDKVVGLWK